MSKHWKPAKPTVELRPSRIRRDPVPIASPEKPDEVRWSTSEREIWLAILGIVLFALAIDVIIVGIGAYWN